MPKGLVDLAGKDKRLLRKRARKAKCAAYRTRVLIVLQLAAGHTTGAVERTLSVARATASRVAARFREHGLAGLIDQRIRNGRRRVTDTYMLHLEELLGSLPSAHGWSRPTWTCLLLARQLARDTGLTLSAAHIGRLMRKIGARWKRPKPVVICPRPRRKRLHRLRFLRKLIQDAPADEAVFYVDEMDIDLNPKIGFEWMRRGVQRRVTTPGKNQKRYLAGAMHATTKRLAWVFAERKSSPLFISLVHELMFRYQHLRRVHLILENYSIHSSRRTQRALQMYGEALVLHFLPPYCPDANKIERRWLDIHADVTRNHQAENFDALVRNVDRALRARSKNPRRSLALIEAEPKVLRNHAA